jgi:RND superfamily putative drug exporter
LKGFPCCGHAVGPGAATGYGEVIALPAHETVNNVTLAPAQGVQRALKNDAGVVGLTGQGPIQQDYSHAVFGNFPLMFALNALATFILLVRAFRSLVLAIKAVVLNLVSLGATFGLITWFWQEGHDSNAIFGIPATGALTFWIPADDFHVPVRIIDGL